MQPDIAARYEETYHYWQEHVRQPKKKIRFEYPQPLSFDMPEEKEFRYGSIGILSSGYMDDKRMYAEVKGSRYLWGLLAGSIAIYPFLTIFLNIISWSWTQMGWVSWFFTILCSILCIYPGRKYFYGIRKCDVFERDTGNLYLWQGDNKPHKVLDFYDQYFFVRAHTTNGINETGAVWIIPRVKKTNGEFETLDPRCLTSGPCKSDGMAAWCLILRFMDKNNPFGERDYKFFKGIKKQKKQRGIKIQSIIHEDGAKEIF